MSELNINVVQLGEKEGKEQFRNSVLQVLDKLKDQRVISKNDYSRARRFAGSRQRKAVENALATAEWVKQRLGSMDIEDAKGVLEVVAKPGIPDDQSAEKIRDVVVGLLHNDSQKIRDDAFYNIATILCLKNFKLLRENTK